MKCLITPCLCVIIGFAAECGVSYCCSHVVNQQISSCAAREQQRVNTYKQEYPGPAVVPQPVGVQVTTYNPPGYD
jgi:hypothetical protein